MHAKYSFSLVLITIVGILPGISALICYSCDSLTYPGCGYEVNTTVSNVPTIDCEEVPQCSTYVVDRLTERVLRGCRNYDLCTEFGCTLCPSDRCNFDQEITETCISCTSDSTNNFCESDVAANNAVIRCPDTTEDKAGCYLQVKGNVYTRDCVANLREDVFEECLKGDDCKICKEDGCNSKDEFQRCYSCDSEGDENCVSRPDEKYITQCVNYDDHCLSVAIPNGKTTRGCSSEVNPEPSFCPSTNCEVCTSVECNKQLVPANRITCHQCNSNDAGCMAKQTTLQSYDRGCNIYNPEDRCFTYVDDDGLGYRGCMSDLSAQSDICTKDPEKCKICNENNCNSELIEQDSELFCYHCLEDDEACQWRQKIPDQPSTCQTKVTEEGTDTCYYFKYENGEVRRGCSLDDAEFCSEHECKTCSGDYCNSEVAEPQTCIQCISTDELYPTCEEDARDLNSVSCDEEPYYEDRGCYSFKDGEDVVVRGCWNGVADEHKALCVAEDNTDDRCNKCFGNGCNRYDHSASVPLFVALPLVLFCTLFSVMWK